MYWILIKKELSASAIQETLKSLFPELVFHHVPSSDPEIVDHPYFHCKDGRNYTFTVHRWTEALKTKIEFHDLDETPAIQMTQSIGYRISATYQTIAVTELNSVDVQPSYRALMIQQDSLFIIDDEGIESDTFEFKVIGKYEGSISVR